MRFTFLILALLVFSPVIVLISIYNKIVRLNNRADEAWSDVLACLKQRYDLIPNLLSTVKGYMEHERGVLEEIVKLRGQALLFRPKEVAEMEGKFRGAFSKLFALAENYPQLKASENFKQLQEELSELEETIQKARRYYNAVVRDYNNAITTFPGIIVASIFGFKKRDYFEVDEEEAKPIEIKF